MNADVIRGARALMRALGGLALLLSPPLVGVVSAHGAGGAARAPLVIDADGAPVAVALSTGMALRDANGWSYRCAALWGDVAQPEVAATGAGFPIWIAGDDGLYRLDADGALRLAGASTPDVARVRHLRSGGDLAFALADEVVGASLWRLSAAGPERVATLARRWDALAVTADGRVYLGAWRDGALVIEQRRADGSLEATRALGEGLAPVEVRLRAVDARLFALYSDGFVWTLAEVVGAQLTPLLTHASAPLGPARVDDRLLVALDGALHELAAGAARPLGVEGLRCLGPLPGAGGGYACLTPDLWPVDARGLGAAPLFVTAALGPPQTAALDPEQAARCLLDWRHFADEAGLDADAASGEDAAPDVAPDVAPGADDEARGCACDARRSPADGRARGALALLLLGSGWVAWRRARQAR